MSAAQKLIAEVIAAEIDEHGYEDDDEKRWQVAYHWATEIDKALGRLTRKTGMVHGECDCGNECHSSWCDEKCSSQTLLAPSGSRWVSGWMQTQ